MLTKFMPDRLCSDLTRTKQKNCSYQKDKKKTERRVVIFICTLFLSVLLCNSIHGETEFPGVNEMAVHKASCRVSCYREKAERDGRRKGAMGSGIVCGYNNGQYLILTNSHVVEGCDLFACDFFYTGKIIHVNARLVGKWRFDDGSADFALLTVEKNELGDYEPPVIPPAGPNVKPKIGSRILSAGCPEGRWAAVWCGTVKDYFGQTCQFYPAPLPGQSGSAVVQVVEGELRITAVVTWRIGNEQTMNEDQMLGGAIPIKALYDVLSGRRPTGSGNNIPPYAKTITTVSTDSKKSKNSVGGTQIAAQNNIPENARHAILVGHEGDRYFPSGLHRSNFTKIANNNVTNEAALLYFTWKECLPCKKEADPVIEWLVNSGFDIKTFHYEIEQDKAEFKKYGILSTPSFVFLDSSGNVKEKWIGPKNLKEKALNLFIADSQESYKKGKNSELKLGLAETNTKEQPIYENIRKRNGNILNLDAKKSPILPKSPESNKKENNSQNLKELDKKPNTEQPSPKADQKNLDNKIDKKNNSENALPPKELQTDETINAARPIPVPAVPQKNEKYERSSSQDLQWDMSNQFKHDLIRNEKPEKQGQETNDYSSWFGKRPEKIPPKNNESSENELEESRRLGIIGDAFDKGTQKISENISVLISNRMAILTAQLWIWLKATVGKIIITACALIAAIFFLGWLSRSFILKVGKIRMPRITWEKSNKKEE